MALKTLRAIFCSSFNVKKNVSVNLIKLLLLQHPQLSRISTERLPLFLPCLMVQFAAVAFVITKGVLIGSSTLRFTDKSMSGLARPIRRIPIIRSQQSNRIARTGRHKDETPPPSPFSGATFYKRRASPPSRTPHILSSVSLHPPQCSEGPPVNPPPTPPPPQQSSTSFPPAWPCGTLQPSLLPVRGIWNGAASLVMKPLSYQPTPPHPTIPRPTLYT